MYRKISPRLWQECAQLLDRNPNAALALARELEAVAARSRNPARRVQASLLLIRALNTCGEFRPALALCIAAARRFQKWGGETALAQVWLEAAWAESYLGNLPSAEKALKDAARVIASLPDDLRLTTRRDWVRARILRERGSLQEALALFMQVYTQVTEAGTALDAVRVLREMGHTHTRINAADAVAPLQEARAHAAALAAPIERALCELYLAQAYSDLNRYPEARALLASAQKTFRAHRMTFFRASCDMDWAYLLSEQDQIAEAITHYKRARAAFVRVDAVQEVSSCEINLGWQMLRLNRYPEALDYFSSAAKTAQATGRMTKAALCFENMGMAFERQGLYARALEQQQRAREIFAREKAMPRLVECDLALGSLHVQLGAYAEALIELDRARAVCKKQGMVTRLGECELFRTRVLEAFGKPAAARRALNHARALFAQNGQALLSAHCALAGARLEPDHATALAQLTHGHDVFQANELYVDAALCDLRRAELHMKWREWGAAQSALDAARRVLGSGFPDLDWRVEHGLGKIAQAQGDVAGARKHYLDAAHILAELRGDLRVERLSDSLFGARRYALADALRFMRRHRFNTDALTLIETSKAQAFLRVLALYQWRALDSSPRVRELDRKEQALRERLTAVRATFATEATAQAKGSLFGFREGPDLAPRLAELSALEQDHEQMVTHLHVARRGMAGVPSLRSFDLEHFRQMAQARWGDTWCVLDYYFAQGRLYLIYLTPGDIRLISSRWSRYDQAVLDRCTSTHPDERELIYRGTLHGAPAPSQGAAHLRHLAQRLLPPDFFTDHSKRMCIISPHHRLHQLPFQALTAESAPLVERCNFIYTPNLQALAELVGAGVGARRNNGNDGRALLYGISNFDGQASPLIHTRAEIRSLRSLAPGHTQVAWQKQATRGQLLEWNRTGELQSFDRLHFATHAIVQPDAPHTSRIVLADGDLTVMDISELNLNARVVTLSACASAVNQGGSGDEWVGLSRAFFYAGARAIVAALWEVEDESTARLMKYFYQGMQKGMPVGEALQQAQLTLYHEGATAFQWAPFVAIGAV